MLSSRLERLSRDRTGWFYQRPLPVTALVLACAFVCAQWVACPAGVRADARSDFLVRMLGTSEQFRVRVQAALGLGNVEPSKRVVSALSRALGDEVAAVRAAAISSLGRLGDPGAIAVLKRRLQDSDWAVRAAAKRAIKTLRKRRKEAPSDAPKVVPGPTVARYYVGVGVPGLRDELSPALAEALQKYVKRTVREIPGVVIAPDRESREDALRILRARKLSGVFVESAVSRLIPKSDGSLRAEVSVTVVSYPDRVIRAMLQGAATMMGGGTVSPADTRRAVEGAFTSALRRLPQALEASRARSMGR